MCGIAGIAGIMNHSLAEQCMLKMVREMDHRGPDAEGIWQGENVILGHKRLSIIDLSSAANQPFIRQNHVLVFNGEIYNYLEIKSKLQNKYSFKTNSDTEVVLYAYIEWKERCLEHFNGMFALAIWNIESGELFFARDRLGIKPLYYSLSKGQLIFASEIRAVMASGLMDRKLNSDKIKDYLAYQTVHAPDTLVKDIYLLRPGEYAVYNGKGLSINHYWRLDENAEPYNNSAYAKIKSNVKRLFFEAVEKRLVSDVPLGVFLSGGIDSSAIVGAVSEVSNNKCSTFSIGFKEAEYDESGYASIIAKKFNTNHTNIILSSRELLNRLPEIIDAYDHPSGDGPNSYLISKLVKEKGITVALSGLGGDELFAGYPSFKRVLKLNQFSFLWKLPRQLRSGLIQPIRPFIDGFKFQRLSEIIEQDGSVESVFPFNRRLLSNDKIEKLLNENTKRTDPYSSLIHSFNTTNFDVISKVSIAEISGYTQSVLLRDTDQMSMAHALEVRVPFFDHNLVEYVLGLPDQFKYPKTPKQLLVESLGDLLPNEIIHRKKMGFSFPWDEWMKNELKDFCAQNIQFLKEYPVFIPDSLDTLFQDYLKGSKEIKWSHIWVLVVLASWMKSNRIAC